MFIEATILCNGNSYIHRLAIGESPLLQEFEQHFQAEFFAARIIAKYPASAHFLMHLFDMRTQDNSV